MVSDARSFWQTGSLEELAAEQDSMPIADLDAIAEFWPVDDDPDAIREFILNERAERRT